MYTNSCFSRCLAALIIALALAGCSGKGEREPKKSSAEQLFEQARHSMASGDYHNAISHYENLSARFPFSNQTKQAQLDLIYCYYKNGERESAIDAATQFERENPTHPRVDYALYMRGLANFHGQRNFFHRLLRIDLARRPPEGTRESFSAFAQLLQRYPNSPYVADARQRMIFLRNHLAEHENYVAGYYMERGAYLAALNRAKFAVQNFNGAPAIAESMRIMINAYSALGMNDLADSTRTVLAASFPEAAVEQTKAEKKHWYAFGWFDHGKTGAVEPIKTDVVEQTMTEPTEQDRTGTQHWYAFGWFGHGKTGAVAPTPTNVVEPTKTEKAEQARTDEAGQTTDKNKGKKKPWYRLW